MAIEYFCCYHSYRKKLAKLSDQEVGRLFRSLLEYSETGEAQELTGRESVAFDFIADDIDRAKEAYEEKCRQNQKNGKKGAESKSSDRVRPLPNATDRQQTLPIATQIKDKDKTKSKDNNTTPDGVGSAAVQVQALYNEICRSFPSCQTLSAKRKQAILARFRAGRTLDDFKTVFEKAEASDFLRGSNNRDWRATFDWLIADGNMAKVIDGNYDNKNRDAAPHDSSSFDTDDFFAAALSRSYEEQAGENYGK